MRVKQHFKDIPTDLPEQLKTLTANYNIDYAKALEYVKGKDYAKARGLVGPRTDKQILEELVFEIKENL